MGWANVLNPRELLRRANCGFNQPENEHQPDGSSLCNRRPIHEYRENCSNRSADKEIRNREEMRQHEMHRINRFANRQYETVRDSAHNYVQQDKWKHHRCEFFEK